MEHILFVGFLFIISFIVAKAEIQIEGPFGWAEKLPTWRLSETHWFYKLFKRPVTGYHVWFNAAVLMLLHSTFLFTRFDFFIEFKILSLLVLFWSLEDFLWFVLNPAFGIKNFRKDKIWWYEKTWWWIMPRDYLLSLIFGLFLYYVSL